MMIPQPFPLSGSKPSWLRAFCFSIAGVLPVWSTAQTATWTGAVDSSTTNTANWLGGILPDGTRVATFDTSIAPLSTTPAFAVGGAATWQGINFLTGSTSLTVNLTTGGTLTLGTSGIVNGSTNASPGQTVSSGNVILSGSAPFTQNSTGALTISSSISLGTNALTLNGDGTGTATLSGPISGTGSLTKSGNGTWTLTGANSYTGGTTVSAGVLVGNSTSLKGDILNNAAVTFSSGTYAGAMSGTGSLAKSGSSSLILTGENTYTGGTTVAAGTLQIGQGLRGSISGNVVVNTGARLQFTRRDDVVFAGVVSGGGNFVKSESGGLTLTANNTFTGTTSISSGALNLMGPAGRLSGTTSVTLASGATAVGTLNAGEVSGVTGVANRINPAASLILNGGRFNLLRGTDSAGDQALAVLSISVGSGAITGGDITTGAVPALTFTSNFSSAGISPYQRLKGGSIDIINTNVNVSFTTAPGGSANVAGTGSDAILIGATLNGGDFIAAAAGVVSKPGTLYTPTGTSGWVSGKNMDVSGTNASAFAVADVNSVRFNAPGANSLTLADGTSRITSGMVLVTSAVEANVSTIGGSGSGSVITGAAGQDLLVINNNVVGGLVINSVIADNGSVTGLTKAGAGTLTLNGANTYTGNTTVNGGTLRIGVSNTLHSASMLSVANGATVDLAGTNQTVASLSTFPSGNIELGNGTLTLAGNNTSLPVLGSISGVGGSFVYSGTLQMTLQGTNTYTGGTTISSGALLIGAGGSIVGNVANNGELAFGTGTNSVFGGVVSGPGRLRQSNGVLTLTGLSTYTGTTTINGGTLSVNTLTDGGSPSPIGASSNLASNLVIISGTLQYTGSGSSTDRLFTVGPTTTLDASGSGVLAFTNTGAIGLIGAGNQAYTLTLAGTGSGSLASAIVDNIAGGAGSVVKTGSGTWTFATPQSYTGSTTISNGSLLVSGSNSSSSVTIANGATLGGHGAFSGAVAVENGGHLSLGYSPGISASFQFSGGLTLGTGSILDFQLGTNSGRIDFAGGLLTGSPGTGGVTLNLTDSGGFASGIRYTLFNVVSGTTSSFDVSDFRFGSVVGGTIPENYVIDFSPAGAGGTLGLTYNASAIPEPSTYAALFGVVALGAAVWFRRRTTKTR